MNRHSAMSGLQACAGLLAPLAWMVAVQLGQMLPYDDCAYRTHSTAIAVAAAIVIALIAALLSWRARPRPSRAENTQRRFIGFVAGLTALVINFALALQLLASLMLNPCQF